eukprot:5347434-Alexandrium_andersonii.AAC.1
MSTTPRMKRPVGVLGVRWSRCIPPPGRPPSVASRTRCQVRASGPPCRPSSVLGATFSQAHMARPSHRLSSPPFGCLRAQRRPASRVPSSPGGRGSCSWASAMCSDPPGSSRA